MSGDAITLALLAVVAADDGDSDAADAHLVRARRHAGSSARREREIVEIASLVVAGARARAAGLAFEHIAAFPEDVDLLARIADATRHEPRARCATSAPHLPKGEA